MAGATQTPISFRYFYYDSGELFRVLDSTGTLVEYIIDPAGNITQTNRSTIAPTAPAILSFAPFTGAQGSTFIIYGQNFSTIAANNIVQINGVNATVISATATQLVVQVPTGATAGQVTVIVNGVTVSSGPALTFTPTPAPVINSLSPDGALAATVLPSVAVTGTNMTGAIFNFPSGALALARNVADTSATVQVTALSQRGVFPLVAATSAGTSTSNVTPGNHFIVMVSPDAATGPISVLNTADPVASPPMRRMSPIRLIRLWSRC